MISLQQLDPRVCLLSVLLFALWLSLQSAVLMCFYALLISFLLLACNPNAWSLTFYRLKQISYFLILLWLLLPLSTSGHAFIHIAGVALSENGLNMAMLLTLKSYAVLCILTALLSTLDHVTLGYALYRLGMPAKLIHLLLFTLRYITVLGQTWQQLTRAMQARGFRWQTRWHTYYSVGNLLGMLIVRAVERAQQIEKAMKCRGYCGQFYCLTEFRWHWYDSVFLISLTGILLFLSVS